MDLVLRNRTDDSCESSDAGSLVERAKSDPGALAALYRHHAPRIWRYLCHRTSDRDVADDLLAETFLVCVRRLPRYRSCGIPFDHWLLRIATGKVAEWRRREHYRRHARLSESPDPVAPGDDASDVDERRRWREALMVIRPEFQTALCLHYLEGLTVRQIALILKCREGTVKSRLARGREAMRRVITEAEVQT